jgi:hypothetical protein
MVRDQKPRSTVTTIRERFWLSELFGRRASSSSLAYISASHRQTPLDCELLASQLSSPERYPSSSDLAVVGSTAAAAGTSRPGKIHGREVANVAAYVRDREVHRFADEAEHQNASQNSCSVEARPVRSMVVTLAVNGG